MATPSPALQQFMQNHPGPLAIQAQRYEARAQRTLGQRYVDLAQGVYVVIQRRASLNPVMNLQPGARDPATVNTGLRARYMCPQCQVYKHDIARHLAIHNQHPADDVFCPVCLERSPRNDAITLPEHVLNKHPEVILSAVPHPMQNQERVLLMLSTAEPRHIGRLEPRALRAMIRHDQPALLARHNVARLGQLGPNDAAVSALANFIAGNAGNAGNTGNAGNAVALTVGADGMPTNAAIDDMEPSAARDYLRLLRAAI